MIVEIEFLTPINVRGDTQKTVERHTGNHITVEKINASGWTVTNYTPLKTLDASQPYTLEDVLRLVSTLINEVQS